MAELPVQTTELEEALSGAREIPGFVEGVRVTLGNPPNQALSADQVEVTDFLLGANESVAVCWLLTPGLFCIYEQGLLRSDQRVVIAVPLIRIKRVIETGSRMAPTLIVEVDGDYSFQGRSAAVPVPSEVPAGVNPPDRLYDGTWSSARYQLSAGGLIHAKDLVRFSARLRSCFL